MTSKSRTTSHVKFALWFCAAASAVVLAFLALAGMPHVQSGPGALSVLGTLPNLAVLLVCMIVALICWFTRPQPSELSALVFVGTAVGYCLFIVFILWDCALWGCYTLQVRVLDSTRNPIPGITVNFLQQKAGIDFINALLPDDLYTEATTNSDGVVSVTSNLHQSIGGLVNMRFLQLGGGGRRVSPAYRYAAFEIKPRFGGKATAHIRWSKAGELDNSNMRSHTIEVFEPTGTKLIVFLPRADGDDTFTY